MCTVYSPSLLIDPIIIFWQVSVSRLSQECYIVESRLQLLPTLSAGAGADEFNMNTNFCHGTKLHTV